MSTNKDKSIGASFHAQTKNRRGQLPSVTGKTAPAFKVYANPLEVAALPVPYLKNGRGLWGALSRTREQISEGGLLKQQQISQILWSAAGFTFGRQRTHISVTGISSIETYVVARSLQDIFPGLYHYNPRDHTLEYLRRGDLGDDLTNALLAEVDVDAYAAVLAFTGVPDRLKDGADSRAYRYLYYEVGAAAQCAVLAAVGLDLVATVQAGFYDDELATLLQVDGAGELPLCLVLLGR